MRRAREAASCPYLSACRCWLVDDRTAPVEGLHFHYPATAPKCRVEQRLLAQSCRPVHLRARIRQMHRRLRRRVADRCASVESHTLVTGCFRSGLELPARTVQLIHSGLM
ncbi:hypothetical protein FND50_10235 [Rhodococcus sp. WB9]|nr:hypothetical protein FND50_10235 [Rhodococcus sp. WB9]